MWIPHVLETCLHAHFVVLLVLCFPLVCQEEGEGQFSSRSTIVAGKVTMEFLISTFKQEQLDEIPEKPAATCPDNPSCGAAWWKLEHLELVLVNDCEQPLSKTIKTSGNSYGKSWKEYGIPCKAWSQMGQVLEVSTLFIPSGQVEYTPSVPLLVLSTW